MGKIEKYDQVSALWLDYKNGLKYYILKKVKNEDMANELSHEVLMKVYNSCCSGRDISNVRSWMYQIAHNVSVDYFKKQHKTTHELPELIAEDENRFYQDASNYLEALIALLPDKYAEPLRLSDLEEIKQAEVAQRLNLSLTATKSRIQRARVLLKEKIVECTSIEMNDSGNPASFEINKDCKPLRTKLK